MSSPVTLRDGRQSDFPRFLAIYNHWVETSDVVFDEHPATHDRIRTWFEQFAASGPHRLVVADDGGEVCGWACTSRFRRHPAFRETVEVSVMVSPDHLGRGLGARLYERLFADLAEEPVHRALAGIALPNPASCALHERFGFVRVGVFGEYALKNGRRVSSVWYEKAFHSDPTPS